MYQVLPRDAMHSADYAVETPSIRQVPALCQNY